MLEQNKHVQERNNTRFNAASFTAQKGINSLLLHDNQRALALMDKSLLTYDPTLIRGRSRLLVLVPLLTWIMYYRRGKQFALRDRLRKADAIIVLAGTRGNLEFLHGKIRTAVALYQQG